MPTSQSDRKRMQDAVNEAIAQGNCALANEITANVMVGTTMIIIFALMIAALIFNEIGLFSANREAMRIALIAAAVVEIPITVLNSKYVGTKPWLKLPLMIDLILVCGILSAMLGHNVTLVMAFPVAVSSRYFDKNYTICVGVLTAVLFAVCTYVCGFFGIVNLNMLTFPEGLTLFLPADGNLRNAILEAGINRWDYVASLMVNEYLPRLFAYGVLVGICSFVAGRGKGMIELQSDTAAKTSRIETELDLATRIQTSMLPCILPAFPSHENIDLRAVYHPAKEVGGDFYDYFIIDKTHVGLVIADVSGKGVGAALFMTISKTVLKNQFQLGIEPSEAIKNANRQLCENNEAGLFVTCWAGVYNTETGVLTFVNAGHNPPVLLKKGDTPHFISQRSGFVLAGMENFPYRQEELTLSPGDEMFFYTDGVTEATNADEMLYGNDRLLDCLEACAGKPVGEQLDALKADIDLFVGGADQFDDITVMAMHIN